MPLTTFVDTDGSLNLNAATEQMALSRTLYNRDVSGVIADVKAAGGDVVKLAENTTAENWVTEPDPLPAYVVFAHDGKVWVVVQGTYSVAQWYSNVIGSIGTNLSLFGTPLGTNKGNFQGSWAKMAVRVYAAIKTAQGDTALATQPLNLSGHSLGGAVAWMVGALAKQDTPSRRVDVMTFGSPREEQGAYSGVRPDSENDVQIAGDPVVFMPPNLTSTSVNRWSQQGTRTVIDTRGAVDAASTNDGEISASLLFGSGFRLHVPSTYGDALNSQYIRGTRDTFTTAMLVTGGYLDKSWIDVPALPGPPPTPAIVGGPPGPAPNGPNGIPNNTFARSERHDMAVGITAFQIKFYYNCGQTGWSEIYNWQSAAAAYTGALADAKALNTARLAFSLPAVSLAGIAFAEITLQPDGTFAPNVRPTSYTEYDFTDTATNGLSAGLTGSPYNTLFIVARSLTRDRERQIKLKGIADASMPSTVINLFARPSGSITIGKLQAYYQTLLGTASTGKTGSSNQGTWMIGSRVYRRNAGVRNFIDDISVVTYRNKSLYQVTVDNMDAAQGQRVHVTGATGPGTAGINGDATIVQVGTVGAIQQITLNHGPRCGGDIVPNKYGTISFINSNFAPIADVTFMKAGESKVGKPHGGTRGRRSAPRC